MLNTTQILQLSDINKIITEKFNVYSRFVEKQDAAFIVQLRRDDKLGRFLSQTSPEISSQEQWIEQYKVREQNRKEFYFIFCDTDTNKPYGVNRIYNLDEKSFEVGSWLFSPESPEGLAIIADLYSRDYAFSELQSEYCRFEVRKANRNVVNYHKRFRPELTGEDELNYYFRLQKNNYLEYRNNLLKFIYAGK